ncbi:MAG: YceI family protein [Bacteroidota bacterium]
MKKILFAIVLISSTTGAYAQKYMTRSGKISFFATGGTEKIEAINNEVASILDSKSGDVVFQVPVKSFKFASALMEEHFNENYIESDKFPKSDLKGKVSNISEVNFEKDGAYKVTVVGKLTMHGVTKEVSVPGTITVKGKQITLSSKFKVLLADYEIKIPSVVKDKIAKDAEITVNSILDQK